MKKRQLHVVLRAARLSAGLTLRGVEHISNGEITNPAVSQIEMGREKNPKPKTLRVLARVLKLDFVDLMILAGHLTDKDVKGRG